MFQYLKHPSQNNLMGRHLPLSPKSDKYVAHMVQVAMYGFRLLLFHHYLSLALGQVAARPIFRFSIYVLQPLLRHFIVHLDLAQADTQDPGSQLDHVLPQGLLQLLPDGLSRVLALGVHRPDLLGQFAFHR